MKYKIDFRKGSGIFLYGTMVMMLALIVALVITEKFSHYSHAMDTQMAADSISDATAIYMLNNPDAAYSDASEYAESVRKFIIESDLNIISVNLDSEALSNNLVSVNVTGFFSDISAIDNMYSENDAQGGYYSITRHAATSFYPETHIDAEFIWPADNSMNILTEAFVKNSEGINLTHISITASENTANMPVYAASDGEIVSVSSSWDNTFIKISHGADYNGNEVVTQYSLLREPAFGIFNGKKVSKGDVIGYVGTSQEGDMSNALEFSVYYAFGVNHTPTKYLNPLIYCYGLSDEAIDEENRRLSCAVNSVSEALREIIILDTIKTEDVLANYLYAAGVYQ